MRLNTTDNPMVNVDFRLVFCYTDTIKLGDERMRKETTRKDIMDAFWELYKAKDISKISVREICELAGYHRTTFYAHFNDVYDVLEQLERSLIPSYELIIQELGSSCETLNLEHLVQILLKLFQNNGEYLRIFLGQRRDPYLQDRVKEIIRPIFLQYIKPKQLPDSHAQYIFEYHVSSVLAVISFWFENDNDITKEELMNLLLTISNQGVFNLIQKR